MFRTASASSARSTQRTTSSILSFVGLALVASTNLLLTGCGIGTIAPASEVQGTGAIMQGNVHGGQQPVVGANIQLWAASENGYPGTSGFTAPTSLLNTPVSTGSDGGFSISSDYTCPVGDAEVYITATGGNPGTGTNNNLVMMAALGSCDTLLANAATTFIFMNEVTTVASAYALAQFAAPNTAGTGIVVGTSATNVQGLANAMATFNNLVNLATGQAYTVTPAYANGNTVNGTFYSQVAYLNSSTVPQSRINTLADILAACVNSNGVGGSSTNCSTLFTAAQPSGGSAPTDTLQAILDIAQHPLPAAAPISLVGSTAPFQPSLATAPGDWTLALSFTGAGLGNPNGNTASPSVGNEAMAIDADGNIWVTASVSSGSSGNANGMLAGFSNLGAPLTAATTYNSTTHIATYGGWGQVQYSNFAPGNLAFDTSGNLWLWNTQYLAELSTSSGSPSLTQSVKVSAAASYPNYVQFDATGNLWAGVTTGTPYFYKYTGSTTITSYEPVTGTMNGFVFDSNNNLWAQYASSANSMVLINSSTGAKTAAYTGASTDIQTLVAAANGNVYTCNSADAGFLVFNATNTTTHVNSFSSPSGTCAPYFVVDGLSTIWNFNWNNYPVTIDEVSSAGTALSPGSAGFKGTSSAEKAVLGGAVNAAAIDGSGNLWVLNDSANDGTLNNALVEFIGLAAPVLTPVSLALNEAEIGVRP